MNFPIVGQQRKRSNEGLVPTGTRPFFARRLVAVFVWGCCLATSGLGVTSAQEQRGAFRDLTRPPGFDESVGVLELAPSVELESMLPGELLAGGRYHAQGLGGWAPGVALASHTRVETRIVRSVASVWRMRLRDEEVLQTIDVRYSVHGLDGRQDLLTNRDGSDSAIHVHVLAVPPELSTRDLDGTLIEGGLMLYLDLADVRSAGTYSGTLTVTLEHF